MQKIKNLLLPIPNQKLITLAILSKYNTQTPTIISPMALMVLKIEGILI